MVGSSKKGQKPKANSQTQKEPRGLSFEILINTMADGVIQIDQFGQIKLYNASAIRLLDTNVTLTDQSISQIMPLLDLKNNPVDPFEMIKTIDKTTVFDEVLYCYQDDDQIRLELTVSPIKDSTSLASKPTIFGFIILLRDITKLKDLEQERDEFISIISHELRTPITVIEGTLSNLDAVIDKEANLATIKKFADLAHDQTLFLARMVNDLASLSRAERQAKLDVEPINLEDLMNSLYIKYQPEAEAKNLRLNLDPYYGYKTLTTNKLWLEEILQNLITNAIKYTREGEVTIGLKKHDESLVFEIKDSGIGIPKAEQDKVFERFYRVENPHTRETSGTGLGLYVSQKLAKKLGTKIELQSRRGHGSSFSLSFPISQCDQ